LCFFILSGQKRIDALQTLGREFAPQAWNLLHLCFNHTFWIKKIDTLKLLDVNLHMLLTTNKPIFSFFTR
jgi:hypothetical protein